ILKPIYKVCPLRDFMRDLAVRPLIFAEKIERDAGSWEVALRVQRQSRPQSITSKKPGESRALARARSSITCNQSRAQIRIGNQPLRHADARPIVRLLELRVGEVQPCGLDKGSARVIG